ncbi:ATP synthase subunit I [Mycolicibacter sp. MYC123]|uniref:ATP synthase subunit I n=1 Tax=[Mycobacterium] zoologicum TaxID=2872311 RepID=A0ABU5YNY3_9MYCO|nr:MULTISPECIES: ATP synthase subunit I [unclassified Mycolicibacter]MEB3051772.1 ATP synthase subunit I [Mycolicibacter sp. MYC123]MEB3065617.1 ATP synthase subunit I [Mycolicibacter sp. MYC101]
MTTPAQDAPLVLPSVVFQPMRLLLICLVLTGVAVAAAAQFGHPLFGVFFGLGLALGLGNALLIRRSALKITAADHPLKKKMALNSASRLLVISVIGLAIAYSFRPDGLGVLFGLALFEVVLVLTTTLPVVKKLRAQASESGAEGTAQ